MCNGSRPIHAALGLAIGLSEKQRCSSRPDAADDDDDGIRCLDGGIIMRGFSFDSDPLLFSMGALVCVVIL